jgi:tRNA (guanine-N7-)-methyltransferase
MAITPKYLDIITERRSALQRELDAILPGREHFVLEIGCGHGHFLTAYAGAHPNQLCVGIDLVGERIDRAKRKATRAKLPNLHFIRAEARLFLDTLPAEPRISELFILFPDPWPKLRHNKHRILQPSFLAQAAAHASRDARLYFRTDFAPYFESARETIASDPHWEISGDPWPFEFVTVFQQRAPSYNSLVARCKMPSTATNSAAATHNAG